MLPLKRPPQTASRSPVCAQIGAHQHTSGSNIETEKPIVYFGHSAAAETEAAEAVSLCVWPSSWPQVEQSNWTEVALEVQRRLAKQPDGRLLDWPDGWRDEAAKCEQLFVWHLNRLFVSGRSGRGKGKRAVYVHVLCTQKCAHCARLMDNSLPQLLISSALS